MDKFNERFTQLKQKHNIKSIERDVLDTKQNIQSQENELQKLKKSIDLANIIYQLNQSFLEDTETHDYTFQATHECVAQLTDFYKNTSNDNI